MSEISQNIIAVAATVQSLKAGLVAALDEVDDFPKRVVGSRLNWSHSWEETFSASIMKQIDAYLL